VIGLVISYLDDQLRRIDALAAEDENATNVLQERRTAMAPGQWLTFTASLR